MLVNQEFFSEMTTKQKIGYLFEYYRIIFIASPLLLILCACLIIPKFVNKKIDAHCLILNDAQNDNLAVQITYGFPKFLNKEDFLLDVSNKYPFFYLEEQGMNCPEDNTETLLLNLFKKQKADVLIADYKTMLWAVHQGLARPIEDALPEELLKKLEPYFVHAYLQGNNEGDGKAYGLDISATQLIKDYSGNYKDAVVLIPDRTAQPQVGVNFIKFLFGID